MSISLQSDVAFAVHQLPEPAGAKGATLTPFGWSLQESKETLGRGDPATFTPATAESAPVAGAEAGVNPTPSDKALLQLGTLSATESSTDTLTTAMSSLQQCLDDAQFDSTGLTLTAREDYWWSPFGNYYNRIIEARTESGQWVQMNADLVARDPALAATELARLMGTLPY